MSSRPSEKSRGEHRAFGDADGAMSRRDYLRIGIAASLGLAAAWLLSPVTRPYEGQRSEGGEQSGRTSLREARYYRNLAG
jgi:hypothetical protein